MPSIHPKQGRPVGPPETRPHARPDEATSHASEPPELPPQTPSTASAPQQAVPQAPQTSSQRKTGGHRDQPDASTKLLAPETSGPLRSIVLPQLSALDLVFFGLVSRDASKTLKDYLGVPEALRAMRLSLHERNAPEALRAVNFAIDAGDDAALALLAEAAVLPARQLHQTSAETPLPGPQVDGEQAGKNPAVAAATHLIELYQKALGPVDPADRANVVARAARCDTLRQLLLGVAAQAQSLKVMMPTFSVLIRISYDGLSAVLQTLFSRFDGLDDDCRNFSYITLRNAHSNFAFAENQAISAEVRRVVLASAAARPANGESFSPNYEERGVAYLLHYVDDSDNAHAVAEILGKPLNGPGAIDYVKSWAVEALRAANARPETTGDIVRLSADVLVNSTSLLYALGAIHVLRTCVPAEQQPATWRAAVDRLDAGTRSEVDVEKVLNEIFPESALQSENTAGLLSLPDFRHWLAGATRPSLRCLAADALGAHGTTSDIGRLQTASRDQHQEVAWYATAAIGKIAARHADAAAPAQAAMHALAADKQSVLARSFALVWLATPSPLCSLDFVVNVLRQRRLDPRVALSAVSHYFQLTLKSLLITHRGDNSSTESFARTAFTHAQMLMPAYLSKAISDYKLLIQYSEALLKYPPVGRNLTQEIAPGQSLANIFPQHPAFLGRGDS